MKPIRFEGVTHILAEDQPQYQPLPVARQKDSVETIVSCWELTDEDIEHLKQTKIIWIQQQTFGNLLQPQYLSIQKPF